jgi:hypothetical protein
MMHLSDAMRVLKKLNIVDMSYYAAFNTRLSDIWRIVKTDSRYTHDDKHGG